MTRKPTLTAEERQANRKAYMTEYYKTKRTEILQKRLTKHDCEICFGAYTPAHRAEHMKSPKHQRAVMLRSRNHSPEGAYYAEFGRAERRSQSEHADQGSAKPPAENTQTPKSVST